MASIATVHPEGEVKENSEGVSILILCKYLSWRRERAGQSSEAGSTSELACTHASEWLWEELTIQTRKPETSQYSLYSRPSKVNCSIGPGSARGLSFWGYR